MKTGHLKVRFSDESGIRVSGIQMVTVNGMPLIVRYLSHDLNTRPKFWETGRSLNNNHYWASEYLTTKNFIFKWFRYSVVWYSDPHCIRARRIVILLGSSAPMLDQLLIS